ncbi:MAG: signal peptidase I [Anaerolineales bacterium]|jgi:signal peptidase I
MRKYRRWYGIVLGACCLVLLVAAWLVFAPVPFGGQSSYVIVTGNSMDPMYPPGDLVIVREEPHYQVGDVVAYFDGQLNRYVIHRIVAQDGNRFTLKGDHNGWTDSDQPLASQIIGRAWIQLPGLGPGVQAVRTPLAMALLAVLVGVLLVTALRASPPRKQGGRFLKRKSGFEQSLVLGRLAEAKEGIVFAAAVLGAASILLGVFAFTRPLKVTEADNLKYNQVGAFGYGAPAPAGVYDTPMIQSGEPVYPSLTCGITVDFGYALVADAPISAGGSYRLTAQVSDPAGWQRTLPLQPETAFSGDHFTTSGQLDLCEIQNLVAAKESITGDKQPIYMVKVTPQVAVQGTIGGRPLNDSFAPALTFQLDAQELHLVQPDSLTNPLAPTKAGVLPESLTAANTFSIFGGNLPVGAARRISLAGFSLALVCLGLFAVGLLYAVRRDPAALVDFKYGPLLVGVGQGQLPTPGPRVVEMASIDDLAKLADREGYLILHEPGDGCDRYVVQVGEVTYRFTWVQPQAAPLLASPPVVESELRAALAAGQFEVYYQPILSLDSGKVTAVEALLRWNHPERGILPAMEFMAAAEETGFIVSLGSWALRTACLQLKAWKAQGLPALSLLVNVSTRQLKEGLSDVVAEILREGDLEPERLHLEIREESLLEDPEALGPKLQELRDLGVHLTLDNYCGKSPLDLLRRVPISGLKLDWRSVEKIAVDSAEAAVTRAAVSAAHSMELQVGAEGVETEEQLNLLRSQKVDAVQGYFLGHPMPAEQAASLIREKMVKPRKSPRSIVS